jgi:hypothetical protein
MTWENYSTTYVNPYRFLAISDRDEIMQAPLLPPQVPLLNNNIQSEDHIIKMATAVLRYVYK